MRNPRTLPSIIIGTCAALIAGVTIASVAVTQPDPTPLTCVDQVRNLVGAMKPSDHPTPEQWIADFNDWLAGYVASDSIRMGTAQGNLDTNVDAERTYTQRMAHARTLAAQALDACKAETGQK